MYDDDASDDDIVSDVDSVSEYEEDFQDEQHEVDRDRDDTASGYDGEPHEGNSEDVSREVDHDDDQHGDLEAHGTKPAERLKKALIRSGTKLGDTYTFGSRLDATSEHAYYARNSGNIMCTMFCFSRFEDAKSLFLLLDGLKFHTGFKGREFVILPKSLVQGTQSNEQKSFIVDC